MYIKDKKSQVKKLKNSKQVFDYYGIGSQQKAELFRLLDKCFH